MSAGDVTQGRRVFDDHGRHNIALTRGDYGQAPDGEWQCWPPGSPHMGSLADHDVTEHEDGTITVTPSIDAPGWHGYLERGRWREC